MGNRIGKAFTENSQTIYIWYVLDTQGYANYIENGSNAPQPPQNTTLYGISSELAKLNIDFASYSSICGFSVDFEDQYTALINWTNSSPNTNYFCFGTYTKQPETGNADYRYGFNGQERFDEVYGKGNLNTALFWEYDTRLGRRWNLDPKPVTGFSEYLTFQNNLTLFFDVCDDTASLGKRVLGGLKVLGIVAEMVVGAAGGLATSWTGVGAVDGGIADVHGADFTSSGLS